MQRIKNNLPLKQMLLLVLALMLALGTAPMQRLLADDSSVTITLGVPAFMKDFLNRDIIDKFEQSHPGIKVQLVTADANTPAPAIALDKYLDAMQKYAAAADVLYIDSSYITPAATRAGYFLDLAPLASDDKTLNADDFYPALWNAFQWDKGLWALPTGANVLVLAYKPSVFDAAHVAYPNDKWTLDDFASAIRQLAQKDSSGKVTRHGFDAGLGNENYALLGALVGENLFDASTIPDTPQLDKPSAQKVLDTWAKLDQEGLIGTDFGKAPMSLIPAFAIGRMVNPDQQDNEKQVGTLLPGGKAALDVQGFAVSGGTLHTSEAYELVKYLTQHREAGAPFSSAPARKSLNNAPASDSGIVRPMIDPETQALIDQAIAHGLTISDLRYSDYLGAALKQMKDKNLDAKTALQAAEAQAIKDQATAVARKGKNVVVVATPLPVSVAPGKITLKFGLTSFMRPTPNEDKWTQLARDFSNSDPQVGRIDLQIGNDDLATAAKKYDCFYLPYNGVPSAKLDGLLNLDPFISADQSFDKSDVVGNIMAQLQRDNKTWGLPVMIQPSILKYDSQRFAKVGIVEPTNGWTISAFNDALKQLKPDEQQPPFMPTTPGGAHLLMLMAAYGGLPLDYRTTPPTINFTDPATVTAIRQVLDLAKNGYMQYETLGGVGQIFRFSAGQPAPITTDALTGFRIIRNAGDDANQPADPYKPVGYPKGTQYNVASYGIGTAYISASTQNADACYRWISTIAQHPDLFSAIPARRSLINNPAIAAAQGPDITALYNQVDALLKDPNTITFPSLFEGGVSPVGFLTQHWLYEAFDSYVQKNGDLESALKDAESYAKNFQQCAANIAPYDPSSGQTADEYNKAYLDCAVKVDSRLKSFAQGLR